MSYLRWGSDSDWYVFWENSPADHKHEELLAIWHADVRDQMYSATYSVVQKMLELDDFTAIPGYTSRDRAVIRAALAAFVEDLDLDYARREELGPRGRT